MNRMLVWLGVLALGCIVSCQSSRSVAPPADIDVRPLWVLAWLDDPEAYRAALKDMDFPVSGSVKGARYVQADAIGRGGRGQLLLDLQAARAAEPTSADLAYLEARLLQDPVRLANRFEDLARRWPRHAWIRLGAAGAWLNLDRPGRASTHFAATPDWPDARQFRNLIEARLAHAQGDPQAWRSLLDDAFVDGSPAALAELAFLAQELSNGVLAERVAAERALRRASVLVQLSAEQVSPARAWALVLDRARTELAWDPDPSFEFFLRQLDAWSASLGLPTGWVTQPTYALPFGSAKVLRPERESSELARSLADSGWAVLLGGAWLQGTQLLALSNVDRRQVAWPGVDGGVEVWLARHARGSADFTSGGALFRGFYVRLDFVEQSAERSLRQAQAIGDWQPLAAEQLPAVVLQQGPRASIPENLDLARRLRARACQGRLDIALQQELAVLLLHEAGHLPETLPFTRKQTAWGEALAMASRSLIEDGWLLAEWEYRAQLRALAHADTAHWSLAQLVETAQDPKQPYFRPYRRLLIDLLRVSRSSEAPPLAMWDSLPPEQLSAWAAQLAEQSGIELLAPEAMEALLTSCQVFEVVE